MIYLLDTSGHRAAARHASDLTEHNTHDVADSSGLVM